MGHPSPHGANHRKHCYKTPVEVTSFVCKKGAKIGAFLVANLLNVPSFPSNKSKVLVFFRV